MNINVCISLALAGVAVSATGALAGPVFVGNIRFEESYGSIGGGEYRATIQPGFSFAPARTGTAFQGGVSPAAGLFETFCLEKFEGTTMGSLQPNYRADLNNRTTSQNAAYASGAHGGFSDALDSRTAYLYSHFINKNLVTGYDYVNEANRINDANALQSAIWFIEQEDSTALTGKALALYTEANSAVLGGSWQGLGGVQILNIYTNTTRVDYQDVLVMSTIIPLPTTSALGGLALCGLAVRRRR